MGNCRFLYNNLITAASMITPSSAKDGFVSTSSKDGTGSATMNPSGAFSGTSALKYIIEIDSVASGNEITQATFKWGTVDVDDTYTLGGSGVATATTATSLNNGVSVAFVAGSGNDFELADKFFFFAYPRYNVDKLLFWNRDKRHRTESVTEEGYDNSGTDDKATSMTDSTKNFVTQGVAVGDTINNLTDGSTGTITSIDSDVGTNDRLNFSGGLSGGTDNDFDDGDEYEVELNLTWVIDLGSAQEIKALVLYDHNLTSGAVIHIQGHTADSWGTPDFDDTVTYNADKIVHYLTSATTKRYWRLKIEDADNTDDYIQIGELFLGSYLELTDNFSTESIRTYRSIHSVNINRYNVSGYQHYNLANSWSLSFEKSLTNYASLKTMFEALFDKDAGTIQPLYFNEDSASPNNTWMVYFLNLPRIWHAKDYYTNNLDFIEVLTSL